MPLKIQLLAPLALQCEQAQNLLTTVEKHKAVLDTEKVIKKRKPVRGTKARKCKAQEVSSSESESESEVQEDTKVEILQCRDFEEPYGTLEKLLILDGLES